MLPPSATAHHHLLVPPNDVRRRATLARLGAPSLFPAAFDDRESATTTSSGDSGQGKLRKGGGWLGFPSLRDARMCFKKTKQNICHFL
jgi:hypothetical protein